MARILKMLLYEHDYYINLPLKMGTIFGYRGVLYRI
jgi:hypothetical protein